MDVHRHPQTNLDGGAFPLDEKRSVEEDLKGDGTPHNLGEGGGSAVGAGGGAGCGGHGGNSDGVCSDILTKAVFLI